MDKCRKIERLLAVKSSKELMLLVSVYMCDFISNLLSFTFAKLFKIQHQYDQYYK